MEKFTLDHILGILLKRRLERIVDEKKTTLTDFNTSNSYFNPSLKLFTVEAKITSDDVLKSFKEVIEIIEDIKQNGFRLMNFVKPRIIFTDQESGICFNMMISKIIIMLICIYTIIYLIFPCPA